MALLSFKRFWLLHLFFICFISSSTSKILAIWPADVTLFGDAVASFKKNTIILTRERNCTSRATPASSSSTSVSGVGRAFYKHPIRFLDPSTETAASFRCKFSFTVASLPSCPYGDGLAFVITSNIDSSNRFEGYMGLPKQPLGFQDSFFAVEFSKNNITTDNGTLFEPFSLFEPFLDYVCVNVNSTKCEPRLIDVKSGRKFTVWIEYVDSGKNITIWVSKSSPFHRPSRPVLDSNLHKSIGFKEFMHIGFSASNERGSAVYTVEHWAFERFNFDDQPSSSTTKGHMHESSDHYDHHREHIWVLVVLLGFLIVVAVIFNSLLSSLTTSSCTKKSN